MEVLASQHVQEKGAHIVDTDDERKDWECIGLFACIFKQNEQRLCGDALFTGGNIASVS
jgi:hypothetical protein